MSNRAGPRVLLLMTTSTYRAHAFLEAGRRLGLPVAVGSERAQALSAANPAGHLVLDFVDVRASAKAVATHHRSHPLTAILAADDDGAVLAATAAERLGLRHAGVGAVLAARDKLRMRECLARAGEPSPAHRTVAVGGDPERAARETVYPCVLKPRFLSGSRGVIRADDPASFVAAFRRIEAILRIPEVAAAGGAMAGSVLVEGFVPGVEVALEGLVTDGRLRVLALYDKPDPLDGPYFEETLYVTPSRQPVEVRDAVVARVDAALAAIDLDHGPVHAEARINRDGVWIVEIAPRSIGGLCARTLRFGPGVSLEELILRHAVGGDVDALERESGAAGVMMIPTPRPGTLRAVSGVDEARSVDGVEDLRIAVPVGGRVAPPPDGTRYLGFLFARAGRPEAVERALRAAHGRLVFEIEPDA